MYYRIIDTDSGYEVISVQSFDEHDYDCTDYAVPVKFYDGDKAHEVKRMLNYDSRGEVFERGLVEGIQIMLRDDVEYDPGNTL